MPNILETEQLKPFRFLSREEFAALASQEERIKYLELAIEAVRTGAPMETMPIKDSRLVRQG